MDDSQEYEVESVTRARVHAKRGKKITWKYYVKWKGYDWDESTWEPTDSFQGGSEHILESFWERMDTGGRDISDATAFRKGEELLISGPPGGKGLKRKTSQSKTQVSPPEDVASLSGTPVSAPPLLATRKRRRVQITTDNEWSYSKPKRSASAMDLKNGDAASKPTKRRRGPSGLRKSAPRRLPSAGDSQLDADGETDPDVVEVEDELMQVSAEDVDEGNIRTQRSVTAGGSANGSKKIAFDDLEHFYSGNPIDIDHHIDEQVATQKPGARPRPQSSPPAAVLSADGIVSESQAPASPALSSSESLFGSPNPSDEAPEVQGGTIPAHRARAANPLVKLIDPTTLETTGKQSRITAKARLASIHQIDAPSTSDGGVTKRGGKPGPSRSSAGLITKGRSSLLTATKGTLKSVKGKLASTTIERDRSEEVEEASAAVLGGTEADKLVVTSWSDEDATADKDIQPASNSQPGPPTGEELLKLAGLQTDMETLPDYEDSALRNVNVQGSNILSPPAAQQSHEVGIIEGSEASHLVTDASPSAPEAEQGVSIPVSTDSAVPSVYAPSADETVKANIELAKEQLFPSTQTSFDSFSAANSSFRSTIFGPLYQGSTANHLSVAKNELSTTFKVILRDGVELPLILKDSSEIKARIGDIMIGNSSGSKVAVFYSAEDALAMVSTLKSNGTARVVLEPSAEAMQQEYFSTFLQRFESSQTLLAPVGKEVCVLYSSENGNIAEKLGVPTYLRGLSRTLLISHASIENQLAYVAAVMGATAR